MASIINQIAFTVCRLLHDSPPDRAAILDIKNGEPRDVVTELDRSIHEAVGSLTSELIPGAIFLSEEQENQTLSLLSDRPVVVLDPIDGSQNLSLGLPFSSCLIAIIERGVVTSSAVVSADASRLMLYDRGWLWSNFERVEVDGAKPTYLAYGPLSNEAERSALRCAWETCDSLSSGVYRWGSAAAGLQALVNGQLQSFVGIRLRVWDFLAFLPFLNHEGVSVALGIDRERGSIVACRDPAELGAHLDALAAAGERLTRLEPGASLSEVL